MVQRHELEAAYYHDLRAQEGMDPEVARDLGYLTSPEDFEAAINPAITNIDLSTTNVARQAAHDYYTEEFKLTGPVGLTEQDRVRNRTGSAAARLAIREAQQLDKGI